MLNEYFSNHSNTTAVIAIPPSSGDVKSLSPERSPVAMKDVKWLTQHCTVGFLVAGVWNNRYYATTSAIITTNSRASGQDMIVSGDADGYLRLFRLVSAQYSVIFTTL